MKEKWSAQKKLMVLALLLFFGSFTGLVYAQGGEDNPLVTLSYLNGVFKTEIIEETEQKIEENELELLSEIDKKQEDFRSEMNDIATSAGNTGAVLYTLVTLSEGQSIKGDVGCEALLRVGNAICVSDSNPGIIDTTTTETLNNGQYLQKNHLYLITIEGRQIKALDTTVKLLVRGSYTIEW